MSRRAPSRTTSGPPPAPRGRKTARYPAARPRPAARARRYVPGDERRLQILEAASELFARRGFAGTTTREVAAAVGTSETVLFRHFPTKQDLYSAILEHQVPAASVERWLAELRAMADRRDDQALFRAVVTAVLESFARDRLYHRLMLFAALEGHEMVQFAHARYTAPIVSFLCAYVARRQAEGGFRRARPECVVQMLLGSAASYAQSKALGVHPFELTDREVADQAMLLLAGLHAT